MKGIGVVPTARIGLYASTVYGAGKVFIVAWPELLLSAQTLMFTL